MKITVITSVWNRVDVIEQAIQSVLSQDFKNIEYVIIDANSTDGTSDIINKYKSKIDIIITEPDEGIYFGLNKGLEVATGDVIGFLHSDDFFSDSHVISKIADHFSDGIDGVYSDLLYVDAVNNDKIIRKWRSRKYKNSLIKTGWMPAHPTLYFNKEIYEKHGKFDTSFKISADYEFLLRVLSTKVRMNYIPEFLYKMRTGGESNKSIKNIIKKSREDLNAIKNNKVGGLFTLFRKNISKIKQYRW